MSLTDFYPRNRLTSFIAKHKRKFVVGVTVSGFFGIMIPAIMLGGNHVVEILDSTAFCTETCHDVHYAEAVTFQESPHSEVPCASCHVGTGTANLVKSKLNGLRDVIPAITGNYVFPFQVPLKDRRPSSETCEKCHWSEKFMGDVPQITTSYGTDEANTKQVVTHVLKVGGGRKEVAGGIHRHSSAEIWYLPVDDKLQKIAWVSSDNASGETTEYVDPNLMKGITPERIAAEKRLMDCMDCHNRTTHLFRPPDELIDASIADGSIDVTLPFVKREALKALVPQNTSLQQAYDKIARLEDFYRVSYPAILRDKGASVKAAIVRLGEIARLTTFDKGLDWNTYADNAKHDKPDSDMQIDWAGLAASDTSPGCFRCHGNLVKMPGGEPEKPTATSVTQGLISSNATAPTPTSAPGESNAAAADRTGATSSNATASDGGGPGPGWLAADCDTCHYTLQSGLTSPVAPATSHPIDGLDDCLVCHAPKASKPFKSDHPWSTNEACESCHQSAPKLKALPAAKPPVDAKDTPHPTKKLEDCLLCHDSAGGSPVSKDHPWSSNDTCNSCHKAASVVKPIPSPTPQNAKLITHATGGLENCLACHGPGAMSPVAADHPWSTNATCATCHKPGIAASFSVSASPLGSPVTHPLQGLPGCSACHNPSGPGSLPADHVGRPESFCAVCHVPASASVAAPTAPLATGQAVSHGTAGLPACTTCHYQSGPGPFPASHTGRPASFCVICHTAGGTAPAVPGSLAARAASAARVDLTWIDETTSETGFRVERATSNTFSAGLTSFTVGANAVGYADTTVAGSTTYYYRVFATNSAGDSPASSTASVTTPAATGSVPAAPSALSATAASATRVNLTWVDNAGNETGFRVERATSNTFSAGLTTFTLGANIVSYSDTTVAGSTTYYYRVFATNAAGSSTASAVASSTTPAQIVDAAAVFSSNCAACHGADRQGAGGPSLTAAALSGRTESWIVTFQATHNTGTSLTTAERTSVAQWLKANAGVPAPAAPSSLSASAVSATRIDLTWVDNAGNETGLRVERATSNTFSAGLTTFTLGANTVSYSDTTVAGSTTYYYRVFATNSAGDSPASSTASVATPAPAVPVPTAPSGLAGSATSATQVNLSWADASNNEANFVVQRATNNTFSAGLTSFTVGSNIVSYGDTTVAGSTTYYYRVRASNSGGTSAPSNTVTVTTPAAAINASQLYSSNCAACHGANRQGGGGPALTAAALSGRTESWIVTFQATHNTGTSLTTAERTSVAQWLKANAGVPAPAAPSSLSASAVSATRIDLTWVDNAGNETGLRVERATSNTFSAGLTTFTVGANTASYADTTVAGSTTYYYRVFATNSAGDSPASSTASVATPAPAVPVPTAPSGLAGSATSATQVNLSWADASNNEANFVVQRATNNTFSAGLTSFTVGANIVSYSDTTAAGSTTYYYRVRASNSGGTSAPSNTVTVTTPAAAVDASQLYSSNCAACHGANRQGGGGPALTAAALSGRTESWIVTFQATHNTGTSLTTAERTSVAQWLKANAGVPAPAAPSSLSASAVSATRIDLTWVDNAGNETGLRVERATSNTFSAGLTTFTVGANTASYADTTVAGSTTYYYRVFATNSAGDSPASSTASVTTPAATGSVPAAPSALSATAASATRVNLTWVDNAGNETGFRVERATNSTFSSGLTTFTLGSNIVSYSDTTVAGSTTYYYRVRASNAGGTSAPSNTVTVTTPAAAVDASQLYSSNCASCHGANRQGSGGRPALTAAALSGRSESWITSYVADHNTGRNLTSAQRTALVQWLKATP